MKGSPIITPFTIIIDSREQAPFTFHGISERKKDEEIPVIVKTRRKALATGDYSLDGFEDLISIERKSISDFVSTITADRERFKRELVRSLELDFFAVIVEGTLEDVLRYARDKTRASMKSIYRSVISFEIDFRAHFIFEGSRARAEKRTFLTLKQFHKRKEQQ